MKRKEFRPETDPSVVVLLIIGIFFFFLVVSEERKWKRERERESHSNIREAIWIGFGVVWCGAVIECE